MMSLPPCPRFLLHRAPTIGARRGIACRFGAPRSRAFDGSDHSVASHRKTRQREQRVQLRRVHYADVRLHPQMPRVARRGSIHTAIARAHAFARRTRSSHQLSFGPPAFLARHLLSYQCHVERLQRLQRLQPLLLQKWLNPRVLTRQGNRVIPPAQPMGIFGSLNKIPLRSARPDETARASRTAMHRSSSKFNVGKALSVRRKPMTI